MRSKRVAERYRRMFEVIAGVARHADALHHAPRSYVALSRECDDLVESGDFEPKVQRRPSGFRGIPVAPERGAQTPADLDGRHEGRIEHRGVQADETDEWRDAYDLHGPEPEALRCELGLDALSER